jgi:hypothetical protein
VAVETGIGPNDLLDAPPEVFEAIVDYLTQRNVDYNKAAKGRK